MPATHSGYWNQFDLSITKLVVHVEKYNIPKPYSCQFVSLSIPNTNQIINELIDFFNTFLPDMRSLGYAYTV